jgi:hypothetical protein
MSPLADLSGVDQTTPCNIEAQPLHDQAARTRAEFDTDKRQRGLLDLFLRRTHPKPSGTGPKAGEVGAGREGYVGIASGHEHQSRKSISKPWTPLVLRSVSLVFFAIAFIAVFITVEMLAQVSDKNVGLAVVDVGKPYAWTYGPTAGKYYSTILAVSSPCVLLPHALSSY